MLLAFPDVPDTHHQTTIYSSKGNPPSLSTKNDNSAVGREGVCAGQTS